jgi:hypothetical protein
MKRKTRGECGKRVAAADYRVMSEPRPATKPVAPDLPVAHGAADVAEHPRPPPPPDSPGYPVQRMDVPPGESD